MAHNHPFHFFIELINFDQTVHTLVHRKEQLVLEIIQIKQHIIEQDELCTRSQRAVTEARKRVDSIELEMQDLGNKEKEKKRKLALITNYKESTALQREIDQVRLEQHEREESLLQVWHQLEVAEREKSELQKKVHDNNILAQEQLAKKESELAIINTSLTAHEHQREQKKLNIPADWLEKYETMRLRVSNPVVPLEGNNCSACFHELSHQEIIRLTRGALLECKGCFRFLYHHTILTAP